MKTVLSFFTMILFGTNAFPQTSYELTCRAKAKEIAAQNYSSCVTEARNAQVEEIRSKYQKDLAALKSKYDKELKKMAGKSAPAADKKAAKATATAKTRDTQPDPIIVKGVAKELPVKAATSDATPVQTVSEGAKVVAVGTDKGSESFEKEASDADQVENINTPAE